MLIPLYCSVNNAVGAYYYAIAKFDIGSALFNIGCTLSVILGTYDLCTVEHSGHEKVIGILGIIASLIFDVAVCFYYSFVGPVIGDHVCAWLGGMGFVVGAIICIVSDRISSKFFSYDQEDAHTEGEKIYLALLDEVGHAVLILFVLGAITFVPWTGWPPETPVTIGALGESNRNSDHLGSWLFCIANVLSFLNGVVPFIVKQMKRKSAKARTYPSDLVEPFTGPYTVQSA